MTNKPHPHYALILGALGHDFLFGENGLKAKEIITRCPKSEINNPHYLPSNHSFLICETGTLFCDFGIGILPDTKNNLLFYITIEPDHTYSIYLLISGTPMSVPATRSGIAFYELLPAAKSLFSWYKREYESWFLDSILLSLRSRSILFSLFFGWIGSSVFCFFGLDFRRQNYGNPAKTVERKKK